MSRWISLAVIVLLAAVLYFVPDASPARLAALEAYRVLDQPVERADDAADDEETEDPPTYAEQLVNGPLADLSQEGIRKLRIGGVRVDPPEGTVMKVTVHSVARSSIFRALRTATPDDGRLLLLAGEEMPVVGGLNFLIRYGEGTLRVGHHMPNEDPEWIEMPWEPPSRSSLLPPLFAIALAILLRRPVASLLLGVLAAGVLLGRAEGLGWGAAAVQGVPRTAGYFWGQFSDSDRALIVGFVVFMLAMVGVLTRAGGIHGMMDAVARMAKDVRRTQIAAWLIGLLVFFDDYANTILCGSTMRPLTDRFKIAREKLAYIVDSTAAPVAGLSLLSTWIAFEVSTFSAQLPAAELRPDQGYQVFIESLPYRFYCVFTLLFVGYVVLTGRDFGPMLRAERRARTTGQLVRPGGAPMVGKHATDLVKADGVRPSLWVGLLPVLVFVGGTLFEILRTGGAWVAGEDGGSSGLRADLFSLQGIADVLGSADIYWALFVSSGSGLALACLFALRAGLRSDIVSAAWATLRSMGIAIAILYLAWMLGEACKHLGTAPYLTALLGDQLTPEFLPILLFLLAGMVAFSTGSSWTTMTILLPLVVGLAFSLGDQSQFLGENSGHLLLLMSIGAVLEGAIFGDHCSPISDTTVLSSVACASDHVDHVRTQAPYSITVMLVAMLVGYMPCAFYGLSPWIGLGLGAVVLFVLIRWLGKKVDGTPPPTPPATASQAA